MNALGQIVEENHICERRDENLVYSGIRDRLRMWWVDLVRKRRYSHGTWWRAESKWYENMPNKLH